MLDTNDIAITKEIEASAVSRLRFYLDQFKKQEPWLRRILAKKYTPEQILEAEGKKCVIAVSGLKYHNLVLFFKVNTMSIKEVEPFEEFDTYVEAPISIINTTFEKTLSGEQDSFSESIGDNRVKIRGKRTYYDMSIFNDTFNTLARHIREFRKLRGIG